MSRDHRKLKVFTLADSLAIAIYRATRQFPASERFGLQGQMRRAAVSVAANIVEGCARRGANEYRSFLNIATASAAEAGYLVTVAYRLELMNEDDEARLRAGYDELTATLKSLVHVLEERRD